MPIYVPSPYQPDNWKLRLRQKLGLLALPKYVSADFCSTRSLTFLVCLRQKLDISSAWLYEACTDKVPIELFISGKSTSCPGILFLHFLPWDSIPPLPALGFYSSTSCPGILFLRFLPWDSVPPVTKTLSFPKTRVPIGGYVLYMVPCYRTSCLVCTGLVLTMMTFSLCFINLRINSINFLHTSLLPFYLLLISFTLFFPS